MDKESRKLSNFLSPQSGTWIKCHERQGIQPVGSPERGSSVMGVRAVQEMDQVSQKLVQSSTLIFSVDSQGRGASVTKV